MSKKEKKQTLSVCMKEFERAYSSRKKLIDDEKEDFLFAFGDQWSREDKEKLRKLGMKPYVDNRLAQNVHLLTGMERQNRSDFKAFPNGEEDGLKAEIATILFKDAIRKSDFEYKASDQFKDGVICGESHLELYLDYTSNLLNGKPVWKKADGCSLFPEPGFREYDFSDARYVFKLTTNLSKDDLINMFPEMESAIENVGSSKVDYKSIGSGSIKTLQTRDYGPADEFGVEEKEGEFDLLEKYYKKSVEHVFIGDMETGEITEAEDEAKARGFLDDYKAGIVYETTQDPQQAVSRNPERFKIIKRRVVEIWHLAFTPAIDKPLKDERAWFYPSWKSYPFIPFFARFSTAPLTAPDERPLLIQGIVRGVKGVQEKHNKSEILILRHLNTATNSGWLSEEGAWVDKETVRNFGAAPGANLEYKKGSQKPERIFPMPLSQGHAQISADSVEAIKSGLGINADLLAAQDGGSNSGRAIALRLRQGTVMVQEVFDNFARSKIIAGRFLLSQIGEVYDVETAKRVLGESFLKKNFPPVMIANEETGEEEPMKEPTGIPMDYDKELAEVAIAEVLKGDVDDFDVTVGEVVSSETVRLSNASELKDFATSFPGIIQPDLLIEESSLPQSTKNRILSAIRQAQALQQSQIQNARTGAEQGDLNA